MAKNSTSNDNGRGMEYLYVELLCKELGFIPSQRTVRYQERDCGKFQELPVYLKDEFKRGGQCFIEWVRKKFLTHKVNKLIVDRLSDGDGVKGDVTDIRLLMDDICVNISLKHNHAAFKHQRPSNLPCQCGFEKKDQEALLYKQEYTEICKQFIQDAKFVLPGNNLFKTLKDNNPEYINKKLYSPICNIVAKFINENVKGDKVNTLFRFLVGNLSFYKVISYSSYLEILQYSELSVPRNVSATVHNDSYVLLEFDNQWAFDMRLHTASSRIDRNVSLKFDSQAKSCEVPKEIIEYKYD